MDEFMALEKMMAEMSKAHSSAEDALHNWLCEQTEDTELMKAILKDGKSIAGAFAYCTQKAKEVAKGCQAAMIDDDTVYSWTKEYFLRDDIKNLPPVAKAVAKTKAKATKPKKSIKKGGEEAQLSLFEL